jgi:hypothetical protein
MLIDEHDQEAGGLPNTITVLLSTEEAERICENEILIGNSESGNGMRIIIMIEDQSQPASSG